MVRQMQLGERPRRCTKFAERTWRTKPRMEWEVAATSTVNPDEREFIVDSGASMHMMGKTNLSQENLETRS